MLANNLQFQFSDNEADTEFDLCHTLHCLRQTAATLEFLYRTTKDSIKVVVVHGTNLGILRRAILAGTVLELKPGSYSPTNAGVRIHSIAIAYRWNDFIESTSDTPPSPRTPAKVKEPLPADPNAVPRHCLQFETGFLRDLWSHAHLNAFAITKSKGGRFLCQFRGEYSYILVPQMGEFPRVLRELKASNLNPGMINKFSAIAAPLPKLPGVAHARFPMQAIYVNHRDYAAESAWSVVMDFRQDRQGQRMGMAI